MVKVSCWCQSEHTFWCTCVRCARQLAKGSGVSTSSLSRIQSSSPKANIFLQKIYCFIDILRHLPRKVAKKKNWCSSLLSVGGSKKKKKKKKEGLATFQLLVVGVKL